MTDIVKKDNPVLRTIAREVPRADVVGAKTQSLIERMSRALAAEPRGVALAAPQIGESLRVFIVSGALFARRNDKGEVIGKHPDLVFINPTLSHLSPQTVWVEEGCLSVEGFQGKVKRAAEATVSAYDASGKQFTLKGTGLLAQIFQHEMDHLNGVLYTDKAKDLEKIPLDEWKKT